MKSLLFTLAAVLLASSTQAQSFARAASPESRPAATWSIDNSHSSVQFTVTHLVISEVNGSFKLYDGSLTAEKEDFTDAKINFTVDINSISTDNEMRDNHLKGDDFFNAASFPKATFTSKSFTKTGGNTYKLTGDLTIRDVTKTVVFDVVYGGTVKDGYGNVKAGFKATTKINRFDYNLKWNALTEAGAVVGSDVVIACNIQLKKN
ncbi:MAG: YceI family protein [Bacteroidia bacterium]|nr:YceI family protein [Bacteroidia bacterium]